MPAPRPNVASLGIELGLNGTSLGNKLKRYGEQDYGQIHQSGSRNYRLYKIRTAPLSERYCIENYHSKIIAGALKIEKH